MKIELEVSEHNMPLVRQAAAALADPTRAEEARAILSKHFIVPPPHPPQDLKALLAAMPGPIDLERLGDFGRGMSSCDAPFYFPAGR